MHQITPLHQLDVARFETPDILKKLALSSRRLAELKGIAGSIPNQGILINTLGLQEAKDSSEIENIITTHDELFKDDVSPEVFANSAAKEVLRYRQALRVGFDQVNQSGLLTSNHIIQIQAELEQNNAGFRKLPGTNLKDATGQVVYTPPQELAEIVVLMSDLERFVNDPELFDVDPLIKMALIHHQFESIHPFYDGNGRTGRIIYMLEAIEQTATLAIRTVQAIKVALQDYKHRIRAQYKFYNQDLINNLFTHPYTKIEFVQRDLQVSRITATKYLDALAEGGFLQKQKMGRGNYYVNIALNSILMGMDS